MKTVFARISTAIVAAAALVASAFVFAPAASAVDNPGAIIKASYNVNWAPGGSTTVSLNATRLDFQTEFVNKDISGLVGHTLTVASTNSGLPQGLMMNDSAYVHYFSNTDLAWGHEIGSGMQISSMTPGTVPAGAVAMTMSYTTYWNGGNYEGNYLAAGTTVTSTPRILDNGSPVSYQVSSTGLDSGWYYRTDYPNSRVEGVVASSFTLPQVVEGASFEIITCANFTQFVSGTSVWTPNLKVNGVTTLDEWSQPLNYSFGPIGSGSQTWDYSLSANTSMVSTWISSSVQKVQIGKYYTIPSPTGGATYTPTIEITDQNSANVAVSCTPSAPTGSGTLASNSPMSGLKFTPDATLGAYSEWYVNVYRRDTNALVANGAGMGTSPASIMNPTMVNGMPGSWPVNVAMYAKAYVTARVTTFGGSGITLTSPVSSVESNNYTILPPVVALQPNNPSGGTAEGTAAILAGSMDYSAASVTEGFGFMMDGYGNQSYPGASTMGRSPFSDGKDGFFIWKDEFTTPPGLNVQNPAGVLKLYHYTQTGLDTAFGANGIQLTTDINSPYMRMGWYGTPNQWVAAITKDMSDWTNYPLTYATTHYGVQISMGNMTGATPVTRNYTYTQMDAFCDSNFAGSAFKSQSLSPIRAASADPWFFIPCQSVADSNGVSATRYVLAKSTSAGFVTIVKLNSSDMSVDNYVTTVTATTYPNASAASDVAYAFEYVTGKATAVSQTSSSPNTVPLIKRALMRITKGGTATEVTGENAWHEATPTTTVGGATAALTLPKFPTYSANGSLVGLFKTGPTAYAVLNAGATGGFGTATSADAIPYDEVSAPSGLTNSTLTWASGLGNTVSTASNPVLLREGSTFGPSGSTYTTAQAKIDWASHKVTTQEAVAYSLPTGTFTAKFVDPAGRLNLGYTYATNIFKFIRWMGSASLPAGVNVTRQSTNYVLNAGGDI
ncbi:MAG: hypothetical protein RLZZ600_1249, partial [Actinomycetota bacterium]